MSRFPATPLEMFASQWRNRGLIHASVRREVLGRYRGSALGLLWSFFNPLFMLAVYTFVFSEIFNARWGSGSHSKTEFALVLFAGLIVFNLFAECITRAPSLIISNPNYVKKVVFPLETLPLISFLSALYHTAVSIGVWLVAHVFLFGLPHASLLYLPLIILPFGLFVVGASWALASLGVFLRDVTQVVGTATTVLMFLSPIFYPASALPDSYRPLLYLNPLTPVIEMTRDTIYWGIKPDFNNLVIFWAISTITAWLGFAWFQKTRKGFADVL